MAGLGATRIAHVQNVLSPPQIPQRESSKRVRDHMQRWSVGVSGGSVHSSHVLQGHRQC